jgi:SagB-type dehydrogenase family enzyme
MTLSDARPSSPDPSAPARLFARLNPGVALKAEAGGGLSARFDRESLILGKFSAPALGRAAELETGLPLATASADDFGVEKEIHGLLRRLALHGLVEYRLARAKDGPDLVVIEPQMRDYAPRMPRIDENCALVLSRFAYMRRRGVDMVLESPRSRAIFRLCDAGAAATIASLSKPQTLARLREAPGFPGRELLALLVDCDMAFAPGDDAGKGLRAREGDGDLALWEFHDLLFHIRSTNGRHANPTGGLYAHAHLTPQPPAVRPSWPGPAIELSDVQETPAPAASQLAALLRKRHSARVFDERRPIRLAEVAQLLDGAARIVSRDKLHDDDGRGHATEIAARPYPSGGASYELELYLAVDKCAGLARGFYHYDAGRHALLRIGASERQLEAMLEDGQFAMGAPAAPQILITMAARFGRVSWKYSGFAYSLVLKHVGVLMQTIYLMATEMELGACAIGVADIDLFAKMTGIEFHIEGPVGQIAIGRGVHRGSSPPVA